MSGGHHATFGILTEKIDANNALLSGGLGPRDISLTCGAAGD